MTDSLKKSYAKLLMEVGLNLQKGQNLVISCPVECADFARVCVTAAYEHGAREVTMNWGDDFISKERYLKADNGVFDEFPRWKADFMNSAAEEHYAFLHIYSEDPEALSGVDPDRIVRASNAASNAIKNYREKQMTSYFQWCIGSVPSLNWARKVFPGKSDDEAMASLWTAILDTVRVYEGKDPVKLWKEHIATLKARVKKLNDYNFKSLHYTNSLGTDLTVELADDHYWEGGDEADSDGNFFCANMPTEEIFTCPKKSGVNGIVYSAKPLSLNGDIADNFSFTFEKGKIVKITAEKGYELLKSETEIDEGASYLGEVALVPYDSPISNSGILYYNTLFDENASCHFAFGEAYPLIKGGREMTKEQLEEKGVNFSFTHTDFMIGTKDLSIVGTTHDGREIPIFENGNFAL